MARDQSADAPSRFFFRTCYRNRAEGTNLIINLRRKANILADRSQLVGEYSIEHETVIIASIHSERPNEQANMRCLLQDCYESTKAFSDRALR